MPDKKDVLGNKIARRGFLKGALATGITGAALGAVKAEAASSEGATVTSKHTWEVPPEAIPESKIQQTVNVDVVVVGAGVAGVSAALAASEAGAKVALVEKMKNFSGRGMANGAVGTRVQKKAGIEINKNKLVNELMQWGLYLPSQQLLKKWADRSGEVFDYLTDMAEAAGGHVECPTFQVQDNFDRWYPTQHFFMFEKGLGEDSQRKMIALSEARAKQHGTQTFYSTPAQRLIRDANGRVTGVIAKAKDGSYIKFNASKGVILATGDYGGNQEMIDAWCPIVNLADTRLYTPVGANTGDGINMALWIGATLQKMPHAPMMHPILGGGALAGLPFLRVNRLGDRFMNEDIPQPCMTNGRVTQPGNVAWTVYDSNYDAQIKKMPAAAQNNLFWTGPAYRALGLMKRGDPLLKEVTLSLGDKSAVSADTIEGLAALMGVPQDTFKAVVERYNKMVKQGVDEDFGKDPQDLHPIETGPFYAAKCPAQLLVIVGGLNVDSHLRVLDKEDHPIAGLYAIGNAAGNLFANDYPLMAPGISHGRSWTFGRITGQAVANGTLI